MYLLGVATYISRFIPRFSSKTTVPQDLILKVDAGFFWLPEHQPALELIQNELLDDKVLYIFDPKRDTQIVTDASGTGLGAVLMQGDRPIAYAARSWTLAKKNYSMIEKELLAVVYALRRFHFYTAGRMVEVLTDHQPVLGAVRNVLFRDNLRLDRLFDQVISYDLQWTYVPGKANYLPDYLSRMPPMRIPPLSIDSVTAQEMAPSSGPIYDLIASAAQNDTVVDFVQQTIHDGWPEARAGFPQCFHFLRPHCHELCVADGVLVDSRNRVYVPEAAGRAVLQELHIGHPGQSTMLARARKIFFWPNMQSDVEKLAVACGYCALHRPSQAREPLQPRDMPCAPGEVIATDFFQIRTQCFLAIYDVFLQFPFLWPVRSKSTAKLLRACRAFFQFTGCPRAFWCDQGSAFDSNEFRAFADSIGMRVCYSSAEYTQSNGAAESAVKILKRLRQVSLNENELFWVLLYLQNSAKRRPAAAPVEIFLGCSLRTPLQPQSNQSFVLWRDHHSE